MRLIRGLPLLLLLALTLASCSKKLAEAPGMAAMEASDVAAPTGAMLAYEHHVDVELTADAIAPRLQQLQKACTQGLHGKCNVLDVSQQGGDYPRGELTVRIEPKGVEPLIAMAGENGQIGTRSTHAEDLAVAVSDNTRLIERLQLERTQLQGFQQRSDLDVADMIALSRQLAEVEAQLQSAEQAAAGHRLRIDTQKLSFILHPPRGQDSRSEIGDAIDDFGATLAMGTAWTIRAAAFLIPLGLVVGIMVWLWRWLRRRRRGAQTP